MMMMMMMKIANRTYREALGEPAQLLGPGVPAQFVQLLLDVSGHFPAEQRRRAGDHRCVCRETRTSRVRTAPGDQNGGPEAGPHPCSR